MPAILALGKKKVDAAKSFRHAKRAPRVSAPQSVRLDDASFIEVVGPPIIQESATVEIFFRANKVTQLYLKIYRLQPRIKHAFSTHKFVFIGIKYF